MCLTIHHDGDGDKSQCIIDRRSPLYFSRVTLGRNVLQKLQNINLFGSLCLCCPLCNWSHCWHCFPRRVVKHTVLNIPSVKFCRIQNKSTCVLFNSNRHPSLSPECVSCSAAVLPESEADASGGPESLPDCT